MYLMEEKVNTGQGSHKFTLNNRKLGSMTGVKDVIAFDMGEVLLETELGMLMIKGKDLHVNKLSVEKGEVEVEGTFDSLTYSELSDYSQNITQKWNCKSADTSVHKTHRGCRSANCKETNDSIISFIEDEKHSNRCTNPTRYKGNRKSREKAEKEKKAERKRE